MDYIRKEYEEVKIPSFPPIDEKMGKMIVIIGRNEGGISYCCRSLLAYYASLNFFKSGLVISPARHDNYPFVTDKLVWKTFDMDRFTDYINGLKKIQKEKGQV